MQCRLLLYRIGNSSNEISIVDVRLILSKKAPECGFFQGSRIEQLRSARAYFTNFQVRNSLTYQHDAEVAASCHIRGSFCANSNGPTLREPIHLKHYESICGDYPISRCRPASSSRRLRKAHTTWEARFRRIEHAGCAAHSIH